MQQDSLRLLAQLPGLSRERLLKLWKETFGKLALPGMRRELLVPCLAYSLQENASQGDQYRAELRRLTRQNAKALGSGRCIKPGTRLRRGWKGEQHEVLVLETGYEYRDKRYQNLSAIARQITGTRWSGPAFFGLQKEQR